MSRATVVRPVFIKCPHCGVSEHGVQNLYDRSKECGTEISFGPWQCEKCRHEFNGTVRYLPETGDDPCIVTITDVHPWKKVPKLSLLRLRDLYLVVGGYCDYSAEEKDPFWYDYLFHSHQCPTNILRNVEEIFDKDDNDPHGILRFVAALDDTEENRKKLRETYHQDELFQLFQTDGRDAPTDWPEENKGVIPWVASMRRGEVGLPLGEMDVSCTSTEEDLKQGIMRFAIQSEFTPDYALKKVTEYVMQSLQKVLGETNKVEK